MHRLKQHFSKVATTRTSRLTIINAQQQQLRYASSCCHKKIDDIDKQQQPQQQQTPHQIELNSKSEFWRDRTVWKRAGFNTLNCLIGCSIGDFGALYFMFNYTPAIASNLWIAMPIAMTSGILSSLTLETVLLRVREKFTWWQSLRTAFKMSMVSMLSMELAENVTDLYMMQHGFGMSMDNMFNIHEPAFWISLGVSLCAGFITPLPYNYYMLKKHGKSCH
jgi:hypothetical protein